MVNLTHDVGDKSNQDITNLDGFQQASAIGTNKRKINSKDDKMDFSNPLDYNFSDLYEIDKGNSKLKCWSMMQNINHFCFITLFLVAVVISFVIASKPSDAVKTINSFQSPVPLKEKVISIEDMALNYLVYLRYTKNDNAKQIYENLEASKP